MKASLQQIREEYSRALRNYLAGGGEAELQRAYESGRKAAAEGLGIMELASVHHNALETAMRLSMTPEQMAHTINLAGRFLAQALSPFEMSHHAFREPGAAVYRLNERFEEEAKRVAHILHDDVGQLLTLLHLKLTDLARNLPLHIREQFDQFQPLLDTMGEEIRRISHELRPVILDDLGVIPAVEFLVQGVAKRSRLAVTVDGSLNERPPRALETVLYRVVQESLTNVVNHARASSVTIRIESDKRTILCTIRDDGIGFNPAVGWAKRGLGLIGIRDRLSSVGGNFDIISTPGHGTKLFIRIPIKNEHGHSDSPC
jgi:signal transduction histidine kinase